MLIHDANGLSDNPGPPLSSPADRSERWRQSLRRKAFARPGPRNDCCPARGLNLIEQRELSVPAVDEVAAIGGKVFAQHAFSFLAPLFLSLITSIRVGTPRSMSKCVCSRQGD